jgi:HSP20 family protein
MALIRWEPARELNTIQSEMNRLFNTFFDNPTGAGSGTGVGRRWIPAMDLVEADGEYVLRADLPGLDENDFKIEIDGNVLTVSGERKVEHKHEGKGYYRFERSYGSFARSLTLPEGVEADAVKANFDKGVLEIRIPKPEAPQPRKVAISVGGGAATIEAGGPAGEATGTETGETTDLAA